MRRLALRLISLAVLLLTLDILLAGALKAQGMGPGPGVKGYSSGGDTISYVAGGAGANAGADLVLPKPAGTVENDVMLVQIISAGNQNTLAGWTALISQAVAGCCSYGVYRKVAGASEPSSYTFDVAGTAVAQGTIDAYRGVSTSTPEDAASTFDNCTANNPLAWASLTTATDNAWSVIFAGTSGGLAALSDPSGYTLRTSSATYLKSWSLKITPAGGVAPTATHADTNDCYAGSVALKPQ